MLQNQPYLGDGEGLLLHHLVQHRARVVAHLVKFVNAADAVVAEHQGSSLQDQLPGLRVLHHVCGEAHGAGALPRRVLASGHQVVDVLQQLGLAGAGVSTQEDVDFSAEVSTAGLAEVLPSAAEELQQDALQARAAENKLRKVTPTNEKKILFSFFFWQFLFNTTNCFLKLRK